MPMLIIAQNRELSGILSAALPDDLSAKIINNFNEENLHDPLETGPDKRFGKLAQLRRALIQELHNRVGDRDPSSVANQILFTVLRGRDALKDLSSSFEAGVRSAASLGSLNQDMFGVIESFFSDVSACRK